MTIDGDGDDNCEFKRENRAAKESSPTAVENTARAERRKKNLYNEYTRTSHTLCMHQTFGIVTGSP